ncbi:Cytochrome c oxidase copper chaperone [Rhizina undulata]
MSNVPTFPSNAQACPVPENVALKTTNNGPKPCCVCKDEKAARDECFLLNDDGDKQCKDQIAAYKSCMAGFGFKI